MEADDRAHHANTYPMIPTPSPGASGGRAPAGFCGVEPPNGLRVRLRQRRLALGLRSEQMADLVAGAPPPWSTRCAPHRNTASLEPWPARPCEYRPSDPRSRSRAFSLSDRPGITASREASTSAFEP